MKASDLKVLKVEYLLTRDCQLNCSYCKIIDKSSLRYNRDLDTEQVFKMIDLVSWNWPGAPIIFFGGEPTTRNDLPAIIRRCETKGVKHAVISNSVRLIRDKTYARALVDAGLSNWSISYDGDSNALTTDNFTLKKSNAGLRAVQMFRDEHGIRDLVTCITVTKKNIDSLPDIIRFLTSEGIWSICTPLQCPPEILRYDYSQGDTADLPSQEQVEAISPILSMMASSKRFLMHNEPGWFDLWPKYFRNQTWKCHDKSILTVDADGSLRLCVDIPLKKWIHVLDLNKEGTVQLYSDLLKEKPPCGGCFWDPAYESVSKGTREGMSEEEGRKTFRHELSEEDILQLIPEAQKWFLKK